MCMLRFQLILYGSINPKHRYNTSIMGNNKFLHEIVCILNPDVAPHIIP